MRVKVLSVGIICIIILGFIMVSIIDKISTAWRTTAFPNPRHDTGEEGDASSRVRQHAENARDEDLSLSLSSLGWWRFGGLSALPRTWQVPWEECLAVLGVH